MDNINLEPKHAAAWQSLGHQLKVAGGLKFEERCLRFYETERAVRTPGSEQVRKPTYKEGLEQWRHFEPHLDPLKEALGPEVRQRYSIDF